MFTVEEKLPFIISTYFMKFIPEKIIHYCRKKEKYLTADNIELFPWFAFDGLRLHSINKNRYTYTLF